jgi:hypothetical protein
MATVETATGIRPFQLNIPKEALEDLRRRIEATRLPSKELVDDRSQGVRLATIQELATYGRATTTGQRPRSSSTRFLSSRPRSTEWTFTSST